MLTLTAKTAIISENDIEELVETAVAQMKFRYELDISEYIQGILKEAIRKSNICYIYTPQVCFECLMYVLEEYRLNRDFNKNNYKITLEFAMKNYTSLIQNVDTYKYHDSIIDTVTQLSNVVFNQAVTYYLIHTNQIDSDTDCLSALEVRDIVNKIEELVKQEEDVYPSFRSNTEIKALLQREFEYAKSELYFIENRENGISKRMLQILE